MGLSVMNFPIILRWQALTPSLMIVSVYRKDLGTFLVGFDGGEFLELEDSGMSLCWVEFWVEEV
jgi:hypothetical protein